MGQKSIFLEIATEREHTCQVCERVLSQPLRAINFAHILSKGAYPAFKLSKDNIWLMCDNCHTLWDHGSTINIEAFNKVRTKRDELKSLYYQIMCK